MLNEDENVCWQRDICWTDALINLMNDLSSTTDVLHKPVMMIIRRHEAAHVNPPPPPRQTIFEHTQKMAFILYFIFYIFDFYTPAGISESCDTTARAETMS